MKNTRDCWRSCERSKQIVVHSLERIILPTSCAETMNNRIISFSRDSWAIVWYHAARKNPQSITTVLGYICMRFWYAKDLVLSTVLRVYTQIYSLKGKRSRIRHGNAQWTHTHTFTRCRARAITPRAHGVASRVRVRVRTRRTRVYAYYTRVVFLSSRPRNKFASDDRLNTPTFSA